MTIEINENTISTGVIYQHKKVIENIHFWHKFIVFNTGKTKRDIILRAILNHVHPLDLIPVSFAKNHGTAHFLARNCGAAIAKLANDNLVVPNPENPQQPFKINILLRFATTNEFKVDVQKNIINVLIKRYDTLTKTLNLTKFDEDRGLSEFCPLSQPKILFFVLHLSKQLTPFPEKYILSKNQIKILNPLDALSSVKGILNIDLSDNLIETVENLEVLKSFHITELVLEHNPLCRKFTDRHTYLKCIQTYCPKLRILDGVGIQDGGFPVGQPNFLCNVEGYDLVDQFLQHFFTIYDSSNRTALEGLYHKNAMFSLTAMYCSGLISSATARLRPYNMSSRNLLKLADLSRNSQCLYRDPSNIVKFFSALPQTEHDQYSFNVDLIYYTPKCAVINVTGVFREKPLNLLDPERYLGFARIFALEKAEGSKEEWCIMNEQLHVYNAINQQIMTSFKIAKPLRSVPVATAKDHPEITNALKVITNLNADWSKKCLEECNYDLKKALALFADLYKQDKIPFAAFQSK